MKITDLLNKETIVLDLEAKNKGEIIDELSATLYKEGKISDLESFREDLWERENIVSTEVGHGVAIPHAKSSAVRQPALALGRSLDGITYDEEKINIVFMIAASEGASDEHLQTLAQLSRYLMDTNFREALLKATTSEEVLKSITEKEK